jgi:hypothetical protein
MQVYKPEFHKTPDGELEVHGGKDCCCEPELKELPDVVKGQDLTPVWVHKPLGD